MEKQEVKEKKQLVITRKVRQSTIQLETLPVPDVNNVININNINNKIELQPEIKNETSNFIQNKLKLDKSILLVDTSYWVYYRFFALRNWYKNANPTVDTSSETFNWLEDKQFMAKYEKLFLESLYTITVKYNVPMCNIVFCIDCPYKDIWRYELNSEYKGTRIDTHKRNNFNSFEIFNVVKDNIIPKLQAKYNLSSVMVSKCEADDVVGNLAPFLEDKLIKPSSTTTDAKVKVTIVNKDGDDEGDESEELTQAKNTSIITNMPKIYILASDNDYIQICNDNIILIDGLGKQLCTEKKMKGNEQYLIRKILTGDVSDNIEACYVSIEYLKSLDPLKNNSKTTKNGNCEDDYKKCTPAVITKIVENPNSYAKLVDILNYIRSNKTNTSTDKCNFIKNNQFIKNATIMDFKMIPDILKNKLHSYFDKLV
jgi:5'-3' exonuclease